MRILYDASRLMSRADRSAPTGVDRVCLAYAEWLLSRPDVVTIPVRGRKNRLVALHASCRQVLECYQAQWRAASSLAAPVFAQNSIDTLPKSTNCWLSANTRTMLSGFDSAVAKSPGQFTPSL